MLSLTRRELLQWLACMGLALGPTSVTCANVVPTSRLPLGGRLSRFFANGESARAIGRRYLALTPEESDINRLTTLICGAPENYVHLTRSRPDETRSLLAAQQRADFAAGRTVMVDGWVLSQTEARLCALAALI